MEASSKHNLHKNDVFKVSDKEQQVLALMRDVEYGEVCVVIKDGEPLRIEYMKKSIKII